MPKFFSFMVIYVMVVAVVGVASCQHGTYPQQQVAYLPLLEDVSLPLGFTVAEEDVTLFDAPSGRIVSIAARGPLDVNTNHILSYYTISLPQLGWDVLGGGSFSRGGERLTITPEQQDGQTQLQFRLEPLQP